MLLKSTNDEYITVLYVEYKLAFSFDNSIHYMPSYAINSLHE